MNIHAKLRPVEQIGETSHHLHDLATFKPAEVSFIFPPFNLSFMNIHARLQQLWLLIYSIKKVKEISENHGT